ncbi:MAG: FkbM family methyltransferase [Thermodesulfobacteriota bacterium]
MRIKQKALDQATKLLKRGIQIVGRDKATVIFAHLSEDLAPVFALKTEVGEIKFFCPGKLPEWRARTLLTKEPETIEWIHTFNKAEIIWDIGASVGVYSLYAGAKGMLVLAFEPHPGNYYLLSRNIEINKMDDRISAYCIAFNDTTKLDTFYMANTELGAALNSFGETLDWEGNTFTASLKQAMIGLSIDDFVEQFNPPFPNGIKIDVDGNENKIVKGARKTLTDKRLKSVLVELDTDRKDYCKEVIDILENSGLKFFKKQHAPEFDNSKFSNVYNHIFVRS